MPQKIFVSVFFFIYCVLSSVGICSVESEVREWYAGKKVLFVQGFVAEDGTLARVGFNLYANVVKTFRSLGLDAEISKAPAGSRIDVAVPIILREISISPIPVFLVGHSFGGNKVLGAEVTANSETFENIAGLMAVQSPLHGTINCEIGPLPYLNSISPWINRMDASRRRCFSAANPISNFSAFAMYPMGVLRDFAGVAADLNPATADKFLFENEARIREISRLRPFITVSASGRSFMFCGLQMLLNTLGHENDGVIETSSQSLNCGIHRTVKVDHLDMILHSEKYRAEWVSLFHAAIPTH